MTKNQEIVVAAFTMFGAFLSIVGSSIIVYSVYRRIRNSNSRTYHRLLLGVSVCDIFSSTGWLISPFAAPAESSSRYLSIGNTQSCSAAGFMVQMGVGLILYNACLTIYYLLTIRYSVSPRCMLWREYIMHASCLVWGFGTSILGLPLQIYNELEVGGGCWITLLPSNCNADPDVDCIRGKVDPRIFGYIVAGAPLFLAIITIIVCNILVYQQARQLDKRAGQHGRPSHSSTGSNPNYYVSERRARRTNEVASQATCYVVIVVNGVSWQLLLRQLDAFDVIRTENEGSWTALILICNFFAASAGFGFLLTYLRPRYVRFREAKASRLVALKKALFVATEGRDLRRSVLSVTTDGGRRSSTGSLSGAAEAVRRAHLDLPAECPAPSRSASQGIGGDRNHGAELPEEASLSSLFFDYSGEHAIDPDELDAIREELNELEDAENMIERFRPGE